MLPHYDIGRSYDWNYEQAPAEPVRIAVPSVPGHWTFCGLPVNSPLGMPAGPLLDAAKARVNDPKIDADARLGHKLGVRGTPAFFINGRSLSGAQPLEKFEAVIKEELESARGLVSGGTPRARVYDALCGVR